MCHPLRKIAAFSRPAWHNDISDCDTNARSTRIGIGIGHHVYSNTRIAKLLVVVFIVTGQQSDWGPSCVDTARYFKACELHYNHYCKTLNVCVPFISRGRRKRQNKGRKLQYYPSLRIATEKLQYAHH